MEAFRNESVSEEGNTEIPDFWDKCGADGVFDVLKQHTKNHDIYGACAPVSKESKYFDYGIGMIYDGECIGVTWDRIFKEFLPESNYNMLDDMDFELYPENNEEDCFCEIWIPVERK